MKFRVSLSLALITLAAPAVAQHGQAPDSKPPAESRDWREAEQFSLTNHVQLTSPRMFEKAGEAYFSPNAQWIIFQAVPKPEKGQEADEHYSMYVAKLIRDARGHVEGIGEPIMVSNPGSANTCGFFDPRSPYDIIFGSTLKPPGERAKSGYQRDTSDYAWQFPREMEVCIRSVPEIAADVYPNMRLNWSVDAFMPKPIWIRDGYDAECAYSPDGRYIVNTNVDPETGDGDIYIYDTKTKKMKPIITEKGYDGGPFFSPDGKRICYRSDRAGNDLLQVYVADLKFDERGVPTGVRHEYPITANRHVNWAPYFHPSGEYLVYTTSAVGHHNYEVFAIDIPDYGEEMDFKPQPRRITRAPGFDGMPVFSDDGRFMMWTSQRGEKLSGQERPSSQVWIADVVAPDTH